jgi:hypothetical protein
MLSRLRRQFTQNWYGRKWVKNGKKGSGGGWLLGWGGDVLGFEEAVEIHVANNLL